MLKIIFRSFLLFVILLASVIFYGYWQVKQPLPIQSPVLYTIESGKSFHHVLKDLKKRQWISSRFAYRVYAKLNPELVHIKAGTYQLQENMSFVSIMRLFTQGNEYQFSITFVEGTTFKEWRMQLENSEFIKHTIAEKSDQHILTLLNSRYNHPEGLFFPETYAYTAGTKDIEVLRQAYNKMSQQLQQSWQNKSTKAPYKTPYEALIMASIIEKETGQVSEQPVISSVFKNRLKKRMRLQTDPTIIYGLGDRYTGDITYANIREKTAYNTYQIAGLPPTPIAMPGKSAIEAALNPADTDYLYFVSKGNGEHYFSKTLSEHNKAVKRYIKGAK